MLVYQRVEDSTGMILRTMTFLIMIMICIYDYVIIMVTSFILKNYCSWDTNFASRWIYEHLKRYWTYIYIYQPKKESTPVRISHSSTSQMFLQVLTCTIFYPHDICMERDSDGWNHETWLIFPWGVLLTLRFDPAKPAKRQERVVNPPVESCHI